jgi:hypothetical protein
MAKIKLTPEPTFKAKVGIPRPGATPAQVEFTFKHRDRDALLEFIEGGHDQKDVEAVMAVAIAWELDDEFNADNVERLVKNYPGAGFAIIETYLSESRGARSKN